MSDIRLSAHAEFRLGQRTRMSSECLIAAISEGRFRFLGQDSIRGGLGYLVYSPTDRNCLLAIVAPDERLVLTILTLDQARRSPWAKNLCASKIIDVAVSCGATHEDAATIALGQETEVEARVVLAGWSDSLQFRHRRIGKAYVPCEWLRTADRILGTDPHSQAVIRIAASGGWESSICYPSELRIEWATHRVVLFGAPIAYSDIGDIQRTARWRDSQADSRCHHISSWASQHATC